MHPEIRQVGPGSCPICGMALEPETVSLEDGPDPELVDITRRFWISALFTLPLFVYAMSDMVPGISFDRLIEPARAQWAQLALATPVVLWGCGPFFERESQSLRTRHPNMFTLVDITRRFWISALFTLPLFVYAMSDMVPGISFDRLIEPARAQWAQLALATPVVLWGGWPFFERAWQSLRTRNLNMFTLIGFGVAIAFLFSLVATLLPDIFPPAFRDHSGRVGVSDRQSTRLNSS